VYIVVFSLLLFALFFGPTIVDKYYQIKQDKFKVDYDLTIEEAVKNNDLDGCIKQVEKSYYKNYCVSNYDYCKNRCDLYFGGYLSRLAIDNNNSALCNDNIYCFYEFGKSTLNVDYCLKGTDKYFKNECILVVANKTKDFNVCDYFDQNTDKQNCISSVLTSISESTQIINSSICSKIGDVIAKENCIIQYSNDFNDCYNLAIGNNKDKCINGLSGRRKYDPENYGPILENDVNHCLDINSIGERNSSIRDNCIRNLAKTIDECDLMYSKYMLIDCYKLIAVKQNDANICMLMYDIPDFVGSYIDNIYESDITYVRSCLNSILTIETMEDCEKYSDFFITQDDKDDCVKIVAISNFDLEACNKIISQTTKEECESNISYFLKKNKKMR
jgi:hypothetical protein